MENFFVTMPQVTITTADFDVGRLEEYRNKVESCVEEVNNGRGWDLVVWSKVGFSTDAAETPTTQQSEFDLIQSAMVSPHICYLQPSTSTTPISRRNKFVFQEIGQQEATEEGQHSNNVVENNLRQTRTENNTHCSSDQQSGSKRPKTSK